MVVKSCLVQAPGLTSAVALTIDG